MNRYGYAVPEPSAVVSSVVIEALPNGVPMALVSVSA